MKKTLLIILSFAFLYHINFAQKLKKEITQDELEELKENLKSPVEISFNITISDALLTGDYPKNKEEIEKRKQKAKDKLSKDSENIDLLINVANFYEGEEKIQYLQKALNIVEENVKGRELDGNDYYKVAKIFRAAEEYEKAYDAYQKASEMIPDTAKVWSMLALFSTNAQKLDDTKLFSKKAMDIDLENMDAQIIYCQAFVMEKLMNLLNSNENSSQKEIEVDYTYIDKLVAKYPDKKKYEVVKKCYDLMMLFYDLLLNTIDELEDDIDYSNFFKPNTSQLSTLNNLEKYFKKAIKKEYVDKLFLYDMLGSVYLLQNEQAKALGYFEQVLEEDNLTSHRFYNTAFAYGLQESWTKLTPLIQKKEKMTELDYAILSLAEHKQDKLAKALEICETGRKEFFNSALLLHFKGRIQYDLGNLKDAEESLREAMRIIQNDEMIPYLQALIALEQKKWDNAYSYLQKAEDLGNEKAKEVKETYFE